MLIKQFFIDLKIALRNDFRRIFKIKDKEPSKLTANDITEIKRQGDLRSKPLRESFYEMDKQYKELFKDLGKIDSKNVAYLIKGVTK